MGLGLGGPEARPKMEPSDDVIMFSQPWYALLIKPKIRPLKDTFLRLWHDRRSRRECKSVHDTQLWKHWKLGRQGWQHIKVSQFQVGIAPTSLLLRPITQHSPSINFQIYPFESFTLPFLKKYLVVGILNLFKFVALWVSMKLNNKQEDSKHYLFRISSF